MNNLIIPTTIVDGFFNNPDAIKKLALEQEFFKDPDSRWPGKRTKPLHEIDSELFRYTHQKFLNLFYPDMTSNTPYAFTATSQFQLVDSSYKAGWVHYDPSLITMIIYLNKEPNKNTGTVIYSEKNEGYRGVYGDKKQELFSGVIDEDEAAKYRLENNEGFEEEIIVKNKYNRMLAFDSHLPHGVQDFENDEPRLTLVSFIHNLSANNYPLHIMHRTT